MPDVVAANATAILGALTTVAIVVAVAVLTWHGDITGEAAVAIFGTLGGAGGATAAHATGVKAGAKAASQAK